jgi:hypothetical protein
LGELQIWQSFSSFVVFQLLCCWHLQQHDQLFEQLLDRERACDLSSRGCSDDEDGLQMVFGTIFIQYLFQEETVVQNYLYTICFEEETITHKFQSLLCLCVAYRWKRVQVRRSENSNTSESIFQHRMPEGSCPNPMCLKECRFKGKNTQ